MSARIKGVMMILSDDTIKILAKRTDDIGLSTRTSKTLYHDNIHYVAQLATYDARELLSVPNFGKRGLREIENFFQANNLQMAMLERDAISINFSKEFGSALWNKRYRSSDAEGLAAIKAQDDLVLEMLRSNFSEQGYKRKAAAREAYNHADEVFARRTAILSNWLFHNMPASVKEKGLSAEFLESVVTDRDVVQTIETVLTQAVTEKLNRDGGPA